MGPSIEADDNISAAHSALTEPLLDKTKIDEDSNPEISDPFGGIPVDGVDPAIMEHMGSRRDWYAIGQWIWLRLTWSIMRDLPHDGPYYGPYYSEAITIYILAMIGHGIFLDKLSRSPGRKPWQHLVQVNQDTLPAILSGLRVFCLYRWDAADKFLGITAAAFALFELCGGSWCSALYRILIKENHIFNALEAEYYERRQQSESKETPCLEAQNDGPASQETSDQAGALDYENNNGVDSNSPKQLDSEDGQWQRSWCVIGQWIWILLVWSVIVSYLESEMSLSYNVVPVVTWMIGMYGHGILLAVLSRSRGKCPSLTSINRENLPMMLSACYFFCLEDTADQFLVVFATCFVLSQAVGAAWRFSLTMTFTSFTNMEKDYFESLKEKEEDEAAQLEAQMERMAYLESLPRSDPAKGRRTVLLVVFCLILLRCALEVAQQTFPLSVYLH